MSSTLPDRLKQAYAAHRSGQLDEARGMYQEFLSMDPYHADANNLMGLLYIQSKKPVKAVRHIRRALRADPENAQSHFNLGVAYKDQGRIADAADALAEAARLDPGNMEYTSSHGNALRLTGKPEEAARILEQAFRRASGNRGVRLNLALAQNDLGAALIKRGDPAQGIRHFLRALDLEPGHAPAHMNLGLTQEQLGMVEEAGKHYRAAIKANPDFADAHFQLAHLRTQRSSENEIEAMKRLLDKPGTHSRDRICLGFGLGFALESAGRYAQAFRCMERAHQLQSAGKRFDIEAEANRFAAIKTVFSSERLARPEATGTGDAHPVFIVGMPRSGTTLTEQILASHPDLFGAGESMALAQAARDCAEGQAYPAGLERMDSKKLLLAGQKYLSGLPHDANNARRFTDTTPMNFLFVGFAALLFPEAKFILCERDPMDNGLSLYRQMLTGFNEFAHDLETMGAYFRLQQDLMEHWKNTLGERALRLQYEELVCNSEDKVHRLLTFCGLPFDERCMKFYQSDRVVRSPSAAQVRQPVFDSSIGAWKRYEKELAPLQAALQRGR